MTKETTNINTANRNKQDILVSPLEGRIVPLDQVPDEAFSSGALGQGVGIEPSNGQVCSPADGEVTILFPTGHAVGITTDHGAEVLIHIGLDTVDVKGDGFNAVVKQGDRVEAGQLLIEFDRQVIQEAGYQLVTPVVVTNVSDYSDVLITHESTVRVGDKLLTAVKS